MRRLLLTLLIAVPTVSLGNQWCLFRDGVESCNFVTAEACYETAYKIGGTCRSNFKGLGAVGDAKWCVVSESGRRCVYAFQKLCMQKARAVNGGCVENTERKIAEVGKKNRAGDLADAMCDSIECEVALAGAGIE